MAALDAETDGARKKRGGLLLPLLIGVVLALLAGAGGFWAVTKGPFAPPEPPDVVEGPIVAGPPPSDSIFVPLDPIVVTLGPAIAGRHLLFDAYLEVPPLHAEEVTRLLPRVLDVLNGYLRVIELAELADPTSLAVLRAQMLRRIQTVCGPGRVQDLLVTQFVVN